MSIAPTSNYMSNSYIEEWMSQKTDNLYGQMRDEMNTADSRASAESQLDKIKADILNAQNNGGDAAAIHDEVNAAIEQYQDIPEVVQTLQPIADKLNGQYGTSNPVNVPPTLVPLKDAAANLNQGVVSTPFVSASALQSGNRTTYYTPPTTVATNINDPTAKTPPAPVSVKLDSKDADNWTQEIGNTVDALGKKDQLGLINIQELNSSINQAKQIASALIDTADKSSNVIISHIS